MLAGIQEAAGSVRRRSQILQTAVVCTFKCTVMPMNRHINFVQARGRLEPHAAVRALQ